MAKGNLFLGMGRGSVGDVTFYRAGGQQLSRARNRKPRNPKSNAQLIQRAISASIVQAYKAGRMIFDHSFEGKSVPAGSQRAFLSVNMRKLREQVLAEIDSQLSNTTASVVSPRSTYPVPNAYRISEGSLIQNLFTIDAGNSKFALVAANEGEKVSEFLSRLGIAAGEIFTLVGFAVGESGARADLSNLQCVFGFMRLTVKESAIAEQKTMATATFGDLFTIDSSGAVIESSRSLSQGVLLEEINIAYSPVGAMGVIRSEENSGLRSTSDMVITEVADWGIAPPNLVPVWSQDSGSVDSELILEGGPI